MKPKWKRSAALMSSPARYLQADSLASYTGSTFLSFSSFSSMRAWSRGRPTYWPMMLCRMMGHRVGSMWDASTSIQTSTIADPSRSPSRRSSGLSLRRTYRAMARDSGIKREIAILQNRDFSERLQNSKDSVFVYKTARSKNTAGSSEAQRGRSVGGTYVSGEVLRPVVVAAAPAHGDDLVLGAGLLQAHQSPRHPR
ncbi:hypothetical protein U9M48_019731 [Paspalum notatum var. saurae]|uniref:Uncharacterized protein n=1 Tax=Paspalum notatum var. saurae TaxID=547442 RepID=A0AAQ3WRH7_PASNO